MGRQPVGTAWATVVLVAALGSKADLAEGRALFQAMRYRTAEEALRRACEEPGGSSRAERREAHDLLARALAAQGRVEEAEAVYGQLLREDAAAPAPQEVSPKISEAFLRAKRRLFPPPKVRLSRRAAAPNVLALEVVDAWEEVSAVRLVPVGEAGEARELPSSEGRIEVDLSGEAPRPYRVEALGRQGEVLAQLGSEDAPLVLGGLAAPLPPKALASPPPPPLRPQRPRWLAWTLLGAAAASAAAGATLGVASSQQARAAREEHFASDARARDEAARAQAVWANVLVAGGVAGGAAGGVLWWSWR